MSEDINTLKEENKPSDIGGASVVEGKKEEGTGDGHIEEEKGAEGAPVKEQERTIRNKALFLKYLGEGVGILSYAQSKVGIGHKTYYRWVEQDKFFKSEVDAILAEQPKKVEDKLFKLISNGNTAAIIFYLKSKHPDYKQKLELEGELNVKNQYDKLTDEQLKKRIREVTDGTGKETG